MCADSGGAASLCKRVPEIGSTEYGVCARHRNRYYIEIKYIEVELYF